MDDLLGLPARTGGASEDPVVPTPRPARTASLRPRRYTSSQAGSASRSRPLRAVALSDRSSRAKVSWRHQVHATWASAHAQWRAGYQLGQILPAGIAHLPQGARTSRTAGTADNEGVITGPAEGDREGGSHGTRPSVMSRGRAGPSSQ
ncbi:hypothetical protein HDU67_005903, partial [Dinochytrium kinnereticum]